MYHYLRACVLWFAVLIYSGALVSNLAILFSFLFLAVCFTDGYKAASSIPAERASVVDIGELDVIKYGTAETASKAGSNKTHDDESVSEKAPSEKESSLKGKSQPPSIMGESIIEENEVQTVVSEGKKSSVTFKEEEQTVDEFQEAVEKVQQQIEEEKVYQVFVNLYLSKLPPFRECIYLSLFWT